MTKPKELSAQCAINEHGFCSGNSVRVFAPGARRPCEAPLFTYHCGCDCHGARAVILTKRWWST
ncbi:hypothetical protein [Streptomyces flavofungini]|uniref:hypothetical protein n=1 Tax=Streptomyces flavofungini TaxID=68200 RepID=UPI0034E051CA